MEPLLVVLLGPTGSGKTALSLRLARAFDGEVVSCDSVAVFRGCEIGSAKPSLEERRMVRHHLIDVASPDEVYSAGQYARDARAALAEISGRGKLPVVTGGTGLYLRALLEGLFAGPGRSDALRERLRGIAERRGAGWLHGMLRRVDGAAAERIHANDVAKVVRAIEVAVATGKRMTEAWAEGGRDPLRGYRVLRIGLESPRKELYERINQRAAEMFRNGLVEETRGLMERYGPDAWVLDALGYRQAREHLRGELTLEAAVTAAQQGHRNYAKRQMTWFRREPDVRWLRRFGDDAEAGDAAEDLVRAGRS